MCDEMRRIYKREPARRVFVNRNMRLEKIQFFGFDMDYTLAIYKSPVFEQMTFDMVIKHLIDIGYPEDLRKFEYNPAFPVRGLWVDGLYGNLLKVDGFGNILIGVHGFRFMKPSEIEELYPNKFIHLSEERICVLNTLFNLPETYLVAGLVDYFDKNTDYSLLENKTGVRTGDIVMSYKSIFRDIRDALDFLHLEGNMKRHLVNDLPKYVVKNPKIEQLLSHIRESGKQTFLLTNSEYFYTDKVMQYLLGDDWTSFFDIVIVDARKPHWFIGDAVFRQVDKKSGSLKIGSHMGPLKQGQIYSGGSSEAFRKLVKARGKDVLYIGDHVFGDVLRSKKAKGWRTFLVVPELTRELIVWTEKRPLFEQLTHFDTLLADAYKNLDSNSKDKPSISFILDKFSTLTHEMDSEYGLLGSLFRSGSRTTFFASQVERYADLYASSCCNLVNYPLFYFFRAPMTLMPHESTVDHASIMTHTFDPNLDMNLRNDISTSSNREKVDVKFCHEEEEEGEDVATSSDTETESRSENFQNLTILTGSSDVVSMAAAHVDKS